ncbi:hypothetical protein RRG08_025569 [Elysia crispata]|uniref:Uncharacterized protein n=1 Tax=Elysia crispata TaxID=231223 RepID=A0AAE0YX43_9GAST|nr:hypothetical protein RRG08_025569 [Elysia crispata]
MLVTAVGSAFVFDIVSLLAARFLAGFFATGFYSQFTSLRSLLAIFSWFIFGVCDLYMALMAYLLRDWQYLLLVVSWPAACAAVLCWFMPESLRWLIAKNQINKAEQQIQRIAKINGKPIPRGFWQELRRTDERGGQSVLQLFRDVRLVGR